MADITRRRLLQGAVSTLGLSALGIPGALLAQSSPVAKLTDIDHIIVLMKENRSFDHYFGTLSGVRGFNDASVLKLTSGRPVFHQPDRQHADGYVIPFRLDTIRTSAQRMKAFEPRMERAARIVERRQNGQLDHGAPSAEQE